MNRSKISLTFLFLTICTIIYSQEEVEGEVKIKKIRFGLDLGVDFPNKQYSQFLDGSHPFGASRIMTDQFIRPQLENQFGYPIRSWEFSEVNSYQPSVYVGLYVGFDFAPDWSVIMKMNFSLVKYAAPFVIQLDNPSNFTGEFEQATVSASEQRFLYFLGLERKFSGESKLVPYVSFGAGMNYIQLQNQNLQIRSSNYNITRISNFQNPQVLNYQKIDGFGYGGYAEAGALYPLNDKFSIGIGVNVLLQNNKKYVAELTDGTNYVKANIEKANGFLPSLNSYFRIIWK